MYTVEMDHDITKVVSLDESGQFEDVEVILDDEYVYLRQLDDEMSSYEMVIMTYKQFIQIFAAMKSPEGVYKLETQTDDSL